MLIRETNGHSPKMSVFISDNYANLETGMNNHPAATLWLVVQLATDMLQCMF